MAYFRTYTAFSADLLNFHAPLADTPVDIASGDADYTVDLARHLLVVGSVIAFRPGDVHASYDRVMDATGASGLEEIAIGSVLQFDGQGLIRGGTVKGILFQQDDAPSWSLLGTNLAGSNYASALASADTADDRALFARAFAGNDRIQLSAGADAINAGGGRDMVLGFGGNDTLNGGGGNDLVDGAAGHDLIIGAAGNDLLSGNEGFDTVRGGAGNDSVMGGKGHDELSGGAGADCFLFRTQNVDEVATITDFRIGVDEIWIDGETAAGDDLTFGDLTIRQGASGAVVSFVDTQNHTKVTIILEHVLASRLTEDSFDMSRFSELGRAITPFFESNWHYFN